MAISLSGVRLLIECIVVGAVLALALACVRSWVPRALASPGRAALAGLAIGAGIHLLFEIAGLNSRYCTSGFACRI